MPGAARGGQLAWPRVDSGLVVHGGGPWTGVGHGSTGSTVDRGVGRRPNRGGAMTTPTEVAAAARRGGAGSAENTGAQHGRRRARCSRR